MVQGEAASEKRFVGEVVRRFDERGIDMNDRSKRPPQGGPQGSVRLRLGLAEAEECVRKRDAVQASEKDYRAAEKVVKALGEGLDVPEHGHAMAEEAGRSLLGS